MKRGRVPSALATISPWCSPSLPKYAIDRLSGDHRGLEALDDAAPSRVACLLAGSTIQICEYGRPGRSLFKTAYEIRDPSGAACTSATERRWYRSVAASVSLFDGGGIASAGRVCSDPGAPAVA